MARNLEEIIEDAQKSTEIEELINLWNEIVLHKYEYALNEIYDANKKIRELALKSNGSDYEKGHFYNNLKQMVN